MKVQCTNCGKKFDYDIYMGMCPNCFTYYRKDGDTYQPSISSKAENSPQKQQTKKPREKTKHSKAYHITTVILCSVIILSVVVTLCLVNVSNKSGYASASITELPEPTALSIGASTILPYAANNFSFSITEAVRIQDTNYHVPAGYELVRVAYSTSTSDSQGVPLESEYDFENLNIRWGLLPYLITKSGSYLPPLDKYYFAKTKILTENDADELEISTYFEGATGYFYFLVKENDAKGLRINSHLEQSNAWGHSIDKLETCYEIQDLGVY